MVRILHHYADGRNNALILGGDEVSGYSPAFSNYSVASGARVGRIRVRTDNVDHGELKNTVVDKNEQTPSRLVVCRLLARAAGIGLRNVAYDYHHTKIYQYVIIHTTINCGTCNVEQGAIRSPKF